MTVSSEERALLDAVRRGEEAAFRLLYRAHARRVYSVARRLVGDPHLADDVAQEAWFRGVRKLDRFRGDSAFSTWLVGIAIRCALEALKRRRRDATPGPEIEPDAPAHPELRLDLEAALDRLAPGYRAVVVLHDLEGHTHEEIGALLGIDAGTAKSQLSRGRRALRLFLGRETERTTP
jgi:RNA polymerase sigma-70 factor, ECF subfamily